MKENTCTWCDNPIPKKFMICSKQCLHEIHEAAYDNNVKCDYGMDDVWKP